MSNEAPAVAVDPEVQAAEGDDGDSTWDANSINESTASLTESILDYRKIHGRTYQSSKTTEYWGPNDETQNEGLDISHHFVTLALGNKLYHAPIGDNPQRVLDVGTGTGAWAIDFADVFSSAEVIGTDLSPIQPGWVPPNLTFQLDDAQLEWTWPENHFDFVHMRNLEASIDDWPTLYRRAFRHLKPGGWLEDVEFDIETRSDTVDVTGDHIFAKWCGLMFEAGEKLGKTFKNPRDGNQKRGMEAAGFVDIVERSWKVPIGAWPADPNLKNIGRYNQLFLNQSLEGFALFLLNQVLGWKYEEIMVLVAQMRAALNNPKNTPYYFLRLVYGRKPEGSTAPAPAEEPAAPATTAAPATPAAATSSAEAAPAESAPAPAAAAAAETSSTAATAAPTATPTAADTTAATQEKDKA